MSYLPTNDITATGSLAAAAQTVALILNSQSGATVQITGTWAGTITFEGTVDGTNWISINGVSASTSSPIPTTTVNGVYRLTPGGLAQIRVNMTSFTSGTAVVTVRASTGPGGTFINQIAPIKITDGTTTIGNRADGYLNIRQDPTSLLFDTFESLDTTNTWTVSGTTAPSAAAGAVTANPGTAANGTSLATSKPTFTPTSSAYLQFAAIVQIEAAVITGAVRFFGLGILNGTPTTTTPITNGTVFEVGASDGLLYGRVYSGGAKTQELALTRPTDGAVHRYQITYKASRAYFQIDNVDVGSIPFPNPQVAALSTVFGTVNGATALTTATSTSLTLIGVGDTAKNASQLADGTYPWRKAQVSATGAQKVDGSAVTQPVSGTFFQATQPVSATALTDGTQQSKITDGTNVANVLSATGTAAAQASQMTSRSYLSVAFSTAAVAAIATTDAGNYAQVSVQINTQGTSSLVNFQGSNDNVNWYVQTLVFTGQVGASSPVSNSSTVNAYAGPLLFRYFRLNVTGISAGTTSGTILFSTAAGTPLSNSVGSTQSGTWTVGANSATGAAVPANAFMIGMSNATGTLSAVQTASNTGDINGGNGFASSGSMLFNNASWDRWRNNWNTTTGDTGAKTASFTGATQTNYNHDGASITVLCGTVSGTTPTLTAQLQWSPDGGTTWLNLGPASTAITLTGNTITMLIYPTNHSIAGATPAALTTGATTSTMLNTILPRTWRLNYVIGGTTPSFTITGVYVNSVM